MKNWKNLMITAALLVVAKPSWAVTSSTTTTNTTDTTAPATTTSTETVEHHDYDDGSRHLTLSLGADGMVSNAQVSSTKNGASAHANPAFGYGLMSAIEFGLADRVGIAAGLHVDNRRFQISGDTGGTGLKLTRTIPTITIPVEVRLYALKIVSFGVGGFAAFPISHPHDTYQDGSGETLNVSGNKRNGIDYGLTAALGVNIPVGDTLGLFGEARYNYGFSNSASNSDLEEKIRDLLFTVGVKVKL